MVDNREQLIADWQRRLAEAEAAPPEPSSRPAWLTRVRIRLYRFLLSLYGAQDWNSADSSQDPASAPPEQATVVFDSTDVLPLAGKPAKGNEVIRGVLQGVAGAQDHKQPSGPWAKGLGADGWVVIATAKSGLDLKQCVRLLDARVIINQYSSGGVVKVPAKLAQDARALIQAHEAWLKYPQPIPARLPRPLTPIEFWIVVALTSAPFCGITAFVIALGEYPRVFAGENVGSFLVYAFQLFAVFMAIPLVRPIAQLVLLIDRLVTWAYRRIFRKRD